MEWQIGCIYLSLATPRRLALCATCRPNAAKCFGDSVISPLNDLTALTNDLLERYGEFLSGEALRFTLGFRSERTFGRAVRDGKVPVPLIKLPGRRGYFARVRDVAQWLHSLQPLS